MRTLIIKIKKHIVFRVIPLLLACLMLTTSMPLSVFSVGEDEGNASAGKSLVYDYDTLKIQLDGNQIEELSIYPYEKIDISGAGVPENADYQWQIKHPERNNLWVDIYDATENTIGVSAALISNMLAEDGTAALRLSAYTEDHAYFSRPVTVTLLDEEHPAPALSVETVTFPSALADETTETPEFVTVTINYKRYDYYKNSDGDYVLDTAGVPAFTSYVATLVYNGSLPKKEITLPTIVGYDAYLCDHSGNDHSIDNNESEVLGKTITLNVPDNITQDYVFQIDYLPAKVNYTVRYFLQNIYDDLYVEDIDEKVVNSGFTGSEPAESDIKKTIEGFTTLYHVPDTIAADGSTVFEVYYERNYYLMEFDCAGGYGTDTLYVRHGTHITVADPVKSGYVFNGWDSNGDGIADTLPSTMPIGNSAYTAIWETTNTTYTIVYWRENADDGFYSYWDTAETNAESATVLSPIDIAQLESNSAVSKNLEEAAHFTLNEEKTIAENPESVIVEGDGSTIVNVYYTRNRYTINFVQENTTCLLEPHTHTADCYSIACTHTHIHTSTCQKGELTCTLKVHTAHTAECLICQTEAHDHNSTCCALAEHTHTDACCTATHSHTADCYDYVGEVVDAPAGHEDVTTDGYVVDLKKNGKFIYISGTWYEYTKDGKVNAGYIEPTNDSCPGEHTHGDGNCDCEKVEHSHGDGNCSCTKDEHTHTDACYSDVIHTHTDACYEWQCGETHVHTDVCYFLDCQITEHTHDDDCTDDNETNSVYSITAKYDADITKVWENPPISEYLDDGIVWQSSVTEKYYSFLEKMPNQDITMTHTQWSGDKYTWYYYLEVRPGEDTTDMTLRTDNGVTYKLYHTTSVYGNSVSLTYAEDYFPITGYTQRDTTVPNFSNRTAYLYYRINKPTFKYYNHSSMGPTPNSVEIYFGQSLTSYEISKAVMESNYYPEGLEPGAYEFGGWYTSPGCYSGSEVNWETATMPDSDTEIYAKWTPIQRNVYFYLTYEDIAINDTWETTNYEGKPVSYPIVVDHGSLLGTTYSYNPTHPNGYTFVGWFYMDENGKKRFAPDSMEVKQDLHLFAEWKSDVTTEYEVHYIYTDDNGTTTEIGTVTTGYATAGQTKTFEAKGGTALKVEYQSNYFPITNSHSLVMDADKSQNVYNFEYLYDDYVLYKVRYVDSATNLEIHPSTENIETRDAIVTEKFLPISGYMPLPQNYYITKTLAYDGDATEAIEENIITFYYKKDTDHGLWLVEHYVENVDSTDPTNSANYHFYQSVVNISDLTNPDGSAVVITGVPFDDSVLPGYTHISSLDTVITYNEDNSIKSSSVGKGLSATLDYTGVTIRIYYKRNSYPYLIRFVDEYGNVLGYGAAGDNTVYSMAQIDEKKPVAKYESTVTYTAPGTIKFGNDTYLLNDTQIKDRKISIVTNSITTYADLKDNILTFVYKKKVVPVYYHAVCTIPDVTDFGKVSVNNEIKADPDGSNALPGNGFKFVGWYEDAACTVPVASSWINGTAINPPSPKSDLNEVHYYALFEPIYTDLTITKSGVSTDDGNRSFLFNVKGHGKFEYIDVTVTVQGNSSVVIKDLPVGTYTVTEITSWSWEYSANGVSTTNISDPTIISASQIEVTLEEKDGQQITFTNVDKDPNWLNGENYNENQFTVNQQSN